MNTSDFIRSLTAQQRKELTSKANGPGVTNLTLHVGSIILIGTLITLRVPLWPLLMVIQGILIVFLFTLLHETVHRTVFTSRLTNDLVARGCSLCIGLPANWFRLFHFAHHRHTQDPENDPELLSKKPETIGQYALHLSGIPVWIDHARTLFRNARGQCMDRFVPVAQLERVQKEARWMIAIYSCMTIACVISQSSFLLWVWIVPALLGQPFLRLYLMAEHGRCKFASNVFENSRTTFTSKLVRIIAWNMPYHAEHHAYPMVPFHRLHELHNLMQTRLLVTEQGYSKFHLKFINHLVSK